METRCLISEGKHGDTGCIRDAIHAGPCDVRARPEDHRKEAGTVKEPITQAEWLSGDEEDLFGSD